MHNDVVLEVFTLMQTGQRVSPTTIRACRSHLLSLSARAGIPLLQITKPGILRQLGRAEIAPGTARAELYAFRDFFGFAVAEGYLTDDPTEGVAAPRVPKGEPRPFSRTQIEAMLSGGAYRRTRVMIALGYLQGFRVSQIARMRGDDLDTMTRMIRTVSKGGKERRVPLHPQVAEIAHTMPAGWWFPARDGSDRPIRPASVTDLITKAKVRAGVTDPKLTPHSLRHGFATELVDRGVDIRVIQELMLHEDLSTTQIYTRVSAQRKAEAIGALEPVDLPEHAARWRVAA